MSKFSKKTIYISDQASTISEHYPKDSEKTFKNFGQSSKIKESTEQNSDFFQKTSKISELEKQTFNIAEQISKPKENFKTSSKQTSKIKPKFSEQALKTLNQFQKPTRLNKTPKSIKETPKSIKETSKPIKKASKLMIETPNSTEKAQDRIGNQTLRAWIQQKESASAGSGERFRTFSEIWRKSVLSGVENLRRETAGQKLNCSTKPKSGSICVSYTSIIIKLNSSIFYEFLFKTNIISTRK